MRLNLENDYAFRIIYKFSTLPAGTKLRSKTLSDDLEIPERFTYRILRKLMLEGIVASERGANGGYVLNIPPDKLTMYDVYKAISGDIEITRCYHGKPCDFNDGECKVRNRLVDIQNNMIEQMEATTFKDLIES